MEREKPDGLSDDFDPDPASPLPDVDPIPAVPLDPADEEDVFVDTDRPPDGLNPAFDVPRPRARLPEIGASEILRQIGAVFSPSELKVQQKAPNFIDLGMDATAALERAEEIFELEPPLPSFEENRIGGRENISSDRGGEGQDLLSSDVGASPKIDDPNFDAAKAQPLGGDLAAGSEDVVREAESEDTAPVAGNVESISGFVPEQTAQLAQADKPGGPFHLPPDRLKTAKRDLNRLKRQPAAQLDFAKKLDVLTFLASKPAPTTEDRAVAAQIFRSKEVARITKDFNTDARQRFLEFLKGDGGTKEIVKKPWQGYSEREQLDHLNYVAGKHAELFGYPKPKVVHKDFGSRKASGRFVQSDNIIQIDLNRENRRDTLKQAMGAVVHEAMHAYQTKLITDFRNRKMGADDRRLAAAQLFSLNFSPLYVKAETSFEAYTSQPMEVSSWAIGDAAGDLLNNMQIELFKNDMENRKRDLLIPP